MAQVEYAGIVLTGGGGARMGGVDKAAVELGGQTLLERALAALAGASEVVVVGTEVRTSRPVTFTREDPAGGGPAAGLLAGLRALAVRPRLVVALAVDMPLVTADTVRRLVTGAADDGAALVDESGRVQHLCAAYDAAALERARPEPGSEHNLSMRSLVAGLRLAPVAAEDGETRDLDTWEDLATLRDAIDESGRNPQTPLRPPHA